MADDSAPFRKAASSVVDGTPGFEVVGAAGSGDEAVALSAELEPDIVLIDARMDGTDGVEATRAILAARSETVVVLMSAVVAALPAGADRCGAVAILDKRDLTPQMVAELWRRHRQGGAVSRPER